MKLDILAFWQAVLRQDADAIRAYFHPDALIHWHCTNERFTVEEFIRANCAYPGDWAGEVERVEHLHGLIITVTHVFPLGRSASFHVTSFLRLSDERIVAMDEYWADDGPPPQWRQAMGLGSPICPTSTSEGLP
jgi:hypothetical protein